MNCFRRWTRWTVVVICESTRRRKVWTPTRQFMPGSPPLSLQQQEGPYRFFKIHSTHSCTCTPLRPLYACLRRFWWMRTAFSSRGSSRLLFKSSILCSVLHWVIFRPIFSPPLTISTRSSTFFWTAARTFLDSLVFLESLFYGSATLTLKLYLLTSVLGPCIHMDQIQIFATCKS